MTDTTHSPPSLRGANPDYPSHCCWNKWAWNTFTSDPVCQLVLLAIADASDEDGCSDLSVRELIEKTGYSDRAIQIALKNLESNKSLVRIPRYTERGRRLTNLIKLIR